MILTVIETDGRSVSAVFEFDFGGTWGSFWVSGRYQPGSRRLDFSPGAWISQPKGFGSVGFGGTLDSELAEYSGNINGPGCGGFAARRMSARRPGVQPAPQDSALPTSPAAALFVVVVGANDVRRHESVRTALGSVLGAAGYRVVHDPSQADGVIQAIVTGNESTGFLSVVNVQVNGKRVVSYDVKLWLRAVAVREATVLGEATESFSSQPWASRDTREVSREELETAVSQLRKKGRLDAFIERVKTEKLERARREEEARQEKVRREFALRVQEYSELLAKAEKLAEGATAAQQLVECAEIVATAERGLEGLPEEGADRSLLVTRVAAVRAGVMVKTRTLRDGAVQRFKAMLEQAGPEGAIPLAIEALALAQQVPQSGNEAWGVVYRSFVTSAAARKGEGLAPLRALLQADTATGGCIAQPPICPGWLDRENAIAALRPMSEALKAEMTLAVRGLAKATAAFTKKATEANLTALDQANEEARRMEAWCSVPQWDDVLVESCTARGDASAAASRVADASREKLKKSRITRTAAQWRGQFPMCRKVAAAMDQFGKLTDCSGDCLTIREKISSDWERLKSFEVADGELDAEAGAKVRDECTQAKCPKCP